MKILIVDSSRSMRRLQRWVLGSIGHDDVAEAATLTQALEQASRQIRDVVLVDEALAGADGPFHGALRAKDASIPIIYLRSAATGAHAGLRSPVVAADRYCRVIARPFTPDLLRQCFDDLGVARAARAATFEPARLAA